MQVEQSPLLFPLPGLRLFEGVVLRCVANADPGTLGKGGVPLKRECSHVKSSHTGALMRRPCRIAHWSALRRQPAADDSRGDSGLAPSSFSEPQERLLGATATT